MILEDNRKAGSSDGSRKPSSNAVFVPNNDLEVSATKGTVSGFKVENLI